MSPLRLPRVSLATQVLIGLVLGIATGVFLGNLVRPLDGVGRAFILLLQMAVLPFMVVSLVGGLGRLDARQAVAIARSGGLVLLGLWAIAMAVVLAFPLAFPNWQSASFFSHALVEAPKPVDFLKLYIPANPFASLADAVVPAIVVFSVALGVALIGVEGKGPILDVLASLQTALERITAAVVRLAPLGVFALMAGAAGRLEPSDLHRIQVYILVYCLLALVLVFWVLPGLVSILTPLSARQVLGPVRDALITAFATGSLLIVLPILAGQGKQMLRRGGLDPAMADASVDVLVPASFTLPSMGKLLSLAFVPFAGWFTGFQISASQYPLFAGVGFLSFFGEPVVSLPFLLNLLRIPSDAFQLFLTVDVVTSRFGTLLAALHTLVLAVLGAFLMAGRIRPHWMRVLRFAAVSVLLLGASIGGTRLFFGTAVRPHYTGYHEFVDRGFLYEPMEAKVLDTPSPDPGALPRGHRLARVRERGSLRVGYFPDALPFAFRNSHGALVGFDIEMAHLLARELGVRLELVKIKRNEVAPVLRDGACDVVMSGVAVTPETSVKVHFSRPVGELTVAFVVPDHLRSHFTRWDTLGSGAGLTVGVSATGYYQRLLARRLPDARFVRLPSPRAYFRELHPEVDVFVTAAENGSAWTLVYPQFSVAVPQPDPIAVPMAYPMPRGEPELADYVDAFLELKRADGTINALGRYWFEGESPTRQHTRWSVIRNVLGWVK